MTPFSVLHWVLSKVTLEEDNIWRLAAYPGALPSASALKAQILVQISGKKLWFLSQRHAEMCRAANEQ